MTNKIPKNTRRAQAVIMAAQDIVCYSRHNNYTAKPMPEQCFTCEGPVTMSAYLWRELQGRHAYMRENGESMPRRYTIHVHGELWYEFN